MLHLDVSSKIDLVERGTHLPIMEEFYSLQGEGFHTGKAAYFIRIGGCDIGCHWCDVKESWDASLHPIKPVDDVVMNVLNTSANTVVITGGEPAQYNLIRLTQKLQAHSIRIHLETSGVYPVAGHIDWICVSPKKKQEPLLENLQKAHELKIIVYNPHDFIYAEKMRQGVSPHCHLFLQPEWSRQEKILPRLIEYIQQHPHWRLSLQTHKYIHIP